MATIEEYLAMNYHTEVVRDEDGDYVVTVQELPGCMAHGATPNEAFAASQEAMRSWIESRQAAGLDVPVPKEVEKYSGKILLRIPCSIHRRLAQEAKLERVSLNQYLVSLLSETPRFSHMNTFAASIKSVCNSVLREYAVSNRWTNHISNAISNAGYQTVIYNLSYPCRKPFEIDENSSETLGPIQQRNTRKLITEYKESSCV